MPALDRNDKVTCGFCGTSVTIKHLSRHKLRCSSGALYCPKGPNFFTKSRDGLNYHIAKKHAQNLHTNVKFGVELVKSEIEHREPIIVGFFILQYAKLKMLELCYNFSEKFCDTEKYEELEMDTDSLYLALSEENLEDIILPEKRNEWEAIRS